MNKWIKNILVVILIATTLNASSQNFATGHVRDRNGKAIIGAKVTTVGGRNYNDVVTDNKGYFELQLAKSVTLGSSFQLRVLVTGYKPWTSYEVASAHTPIEDIFLEKNPIGVKKPKAEINPINNTEKASNIKKLFNVNESVVSLGLTNLLAQETWNYSAQETLDICKAYQKYITKSIRSIDNIDWDFNTILDSIVEHEHFNDAEIKEFLKYYENISDCYDVGKFVFQIIDKSKADFITAYFKEKVQNSNANKEGGGYLGRFLRKEYIQPASFYLDFLQRLDKKSKVFKDTYDAFLEFFRAANVYKSTTIDLLNDEQVVSSVFIYGEIYYESSFFSYRNYMKSKLQGWIDDATLQRTYFFSTLCPCAIGVDTPYWREGRKFPCDSTHML